jgi:lysophospholipase L1-like esterase
MLMICATHCIAQSFNDSIHKKYPFIKVDKNEIENASSIGPFMTKLQQLKANSNSRINVIHIGDSHLQAGDFTATMRKKLQIQFGNAGRGLVVPLKVARTNEPSNYHISSNIRWKARRNVIKNDSIDIGIGGVTIKTEDVNADLKLRIFDDIALDYACTKVRIYHSKTFENFDIAIKDSANNLLGKCSDDAERSTMYSTVKFANPVHEINLSLLGTDKKNTSIYGFVFENNNNGLLYHSIGVNGAEYRHYNASKYFVEQAATLNPDLHIISLGTNEAYAPNFSTTDFYNQIDTFVTALRKANPAVNIIITTPGDANKKKKYKNKNNKKAGDTIKEYCIKNNVAYYDLMNVMGGYGSINKWFARGLANKDHLHLTVAGYQLQGSLLYHALMKTYENNVTK